jgi:hypothetical protein
MLTALRWRATGEKPNVHPYLASSGATQRTENTGGVTSVPEEKHMSEEDEIKAQLERLKAENEALKTRQARGLSLRVSEKGGVSVYGLGRFPVTLYKEQWLRLLEMTDDIRRFIRENEGKLKVKE